MSATSELYKLSATDVVKRLKEGLVRLVPACLVDATPAIAENCCLAGHTLAASGCS